MLAAVQALAEFAIVISLSLVAIAVGAIDRRGFVASTAIGLPIIFGGGPSWFAVVAAFFFASVVFTLYRYGYKKKLGAAQEKGGARNWPNILANGGLAAVLAAAHLLAPGLRLSPLFIGAVSASAADTAATEIGLLSRTTPRLVTDLRRRTKPGTSGGVTVLGTLAGAAGASLVGLVAFLSGAIGTSLGTLGGLSLALGVSITGGLTGSLGDSLLGAAVQRKGTCVVCQRQTESLSHCGEPTKVDSGIPFVENNVVNLVASMIGSVSAGAVAILLGASFS